MITKHIPNAITSMNLLCGVAGVISVLSLGDVRVAFILMLAASVFDFCDGLAARLLHAYSDIGKELDSLADMVSFGVLPAVMLFTTYRKFGTPGDESWPRLCLAAVPLLIAAFSALRLAKFNVDTRQSSSFIGLPTPACAIICASLAVTADKASPRFLEGLCGTAWFIPVISAILCLLLISEIPMFSFKIGGHGKAARRTIVQRAAFFVVAIVSAAACLLTRTTWEAAVLATFTGYVLICVICLPLPSEAPGNRP